MKISANFDLREFIPPDVFNAYGASSTWFIQQELVTGTQFIRDYFDAAATINNWHTGGHFTERGYRTPNSTTGSKLSQHKRGAAIDFNIKGLTADQVRRRILDDQKTFLAQGFTAIEDEEFAITWCHIDRRYRLGNPDKILIVRPAEMLINTEDYTPLSDEYFYFENGELIPQVFELNTEDGN